VTASFYFFSKILFNNTKFGVKNPLVILKKNLEQNQNVYYPFFVLSAVGTELCSSACLLYFIQL